MKLSSKYIIGFILAFFSIGQAATALEPIEIETRIGKEIRQKLEQVPDLKAHKIVIRDHGRRVTLLGEVSSEEDRERIERIALSVPRIECLHNLLQVRPDRTGHKLAENIQKDILDAALEGNCDLDIRVNNGFVTLNGTVENQSDAWMIVDLARRRAGSERVRSNLRLASAWTDDEVERNLRKELTSVAGLDASNLQISVNEGTAIFSGSLKNHQQIDEILSIALMTPGVSDIESNMRIGGRKYR